MREQARNQEIQKTILKWMRHHKLSLIALYGFGSLFSGKSNRQSDLDLGILCDRPLSALDRWNLQEELAKCLKRDIDLVDLRSASLVMKMQVITNGKRLYCKSVSLCEAFETYVYSAYCRFQEERKGILEDIEKRGSVYAR